MLQSYFENFHCFLFFNTYFLEYFVLQYPYIPGNRATRVACDFVDISVLLP